MEAGVDIVKNALTLNEAIYVCNQYRHYAGKRVMANMMEAEVVCITVSPADDINKWIFLQRYIETQDAGMALEFYKVPYYDVILIIKAPEGSLSYITIRQPDTPVIL